ncbi:DUF4185 domain-containing protein [Niabella ginsengisoli]|uniref:DUF4185 domain-containing protein n=1 Tax=Niabella ginsengisoli TaxID=522298 RepID=A0ABS9SLB4_9BACT|nr:DUF4185 domain-containing protein [Niabella ginsengisoli]MCH5599172.1 DUF4185 domain-containing protein [Niabella ginsengisoli]
MFKIKYTGMIKAASCLTLGALLMSHINEQHGAFRLTEDVILENVITVARVTGASLEGEQWVNPNKTHSMFDVCGTDLGIIWDMGDGHYGMFFGDTNGEGFQAGKGGGNGTNWRSNVLAFSNDTVLSDGIKITGMALDDSGRAREICAGASANPKVYQTSIPTAAIHAGKNDYVHYMNIYEWSAPKGRWLTNFSSLYGSSDRGKTWKRVKEVTFKPDSKFSQVCYAKKDGWVYMIGTLSGRGSAAYLCRFKEENITDLKLYEYWNSSSNKWVTGVEDEATPIIEAPVGEASIIFNETVKRWIIMYSYDPNLDPTKAFKNSGLVYRDSKSLHGNWSSPKMVMGKDSLQGYAPFIHPLSKKGKYLYFTKSLWKPYNVFLARADIKVSDAD